MTQPRWAVPALAGVGLLAAVYIWRDSKPMALRGGYDRHVPDQSMRGAALDNTLGQVTPGHLLHYGPTMRPADWTPHRMTYPATPGQELERLTYGAPGVCAVAVPRAQRGWLFNPPSEVDY